MKTKIICQDVYYNSILYWLIRSFFFKSISTNSALKIVEVLLKVVENLTKS